jgi:predicted phage tail protein
MNEQALTARREKQSEFIGVGCVIQGLGLLAPFVLGAILGIFGVVVGVLLLVVLFFVGSARATKWICGNCRNPLASKEVTVCAACRAQLD